MEDSIYYFYMKHSVLNYRVIIEPEKMDKRIVYNAFCPSLGIADYGDTIEEVLRSIKDGILLAIECLEEDKKEIPMDNITEQLITSVSISTNHAISAPPI